jgi:hypothetical protein
MWIAIIVVYTLSIANALVDFYFPEQRKIEGHRLVWILSLSFLILIMYSGIQHENGVMLDVFFGFVAGATPIFSFLYNLKQISLRQQ